MAALPGATPQRAFVSLLGAAVILMATRLVPDFAVALGLVAGWVLLGLATPAQALAGFASKEWLFIVTVYGLAAAAARSGILFRVGLLLVRRLPHGLGWQAATLLGTGLALTPLVPSSTGRVSLTEPLALAMAEALRLPARGPAAALLGLAAWVGAGPLMFVFLNGSGTCLLAWGLLPEASEHGRPAQARHAHVDENDVRSQLAGQLEPCLAVRSLALVHRKADAFKRLTAHEGRLSIEALEAPLEVVESPPPALDPLPEPDPAEPLPPRTDASVARPPSSAF